jgi:hypothetical protein
MFPAPKKLIIILFLSLQFAIVIGIAVGFGININGNTTQVLGVSELNLDLSKEAIELEERPIISTEDDQIKDESTLDFGYGTVFLDDKTEN